MITASDVMKLREMTGAGMMEAKKALVEADGTMEKAVEILRTSGAAKAAKKAERETAEGRIFSYTHGPKLAVLVEVLCETDFVARNELFTEFGSDLAMHIAASAPLYVTREQVPQELVEKEKAIYREQLLLEGKPEAMLEKIVEGKLNKFFSDICLMEQPFVKDEDMTIAELLQKKIGAIGENMRIGRFARMQLGAE